MKRYLQFIGLALLLLSSIPAANAELVSDIAELITTLKNTCNVIILFCLIMLAVVFGLIYYIACQHRKDNEYEECEIEEDG